MFNSLIYIPKITDRLLIVICNKANIYYKLAADQGHMEALYNIGLAYGQGTGVKQNYVQSLKYALLSAKQGKAEAQFLCGLYYVNGFGTKVDIKKGTYWYSLSSEQGDKKAKYQLAILNQKNKPTFSVTTSSNKDKIKDSDSKEIENSNPIIKN